jgi:parallel beta-helix repeat protein
LTIDRSTVQRLWGTWEAGGGVQVKGGTATITDSTFAEHKRDGVTVSGGDVSVLRTKFSESVTGIRCTGATGTLIEDNEFNGITQQAILLLDSSAVVKRNTIKTSNIGIAVTDSNVNIKQNTLTKNTVAMDVTGISDVTIEDNDILDNKDAGIRQTESDTTIDDNRIKSNGDGILVTNGQLSATNNEIIGNKYGIRSIDSNGDVKSNEIGGSTHYGLYMVGKQLVYLDNTWSASNGIGRVAQGWNFYVEVTKDGEPAENAVVKIKDQTGEEIYSGVTNDTGVTGRIELIQKYMDNGGSTVDTTPHTVNVNYNGKKGKKKLEVTRNQTLEVEVGGGKVTEPDWQMIALSAGIILMAVAISLGIHLWRTSGDKGPKRKSTRAPRGKRRRRSREPAKKKGGGGRRRRRRPGKKRRKASKRRRRRRR